MLRPHDVDVSRGEEAGEGPAPEGSREVAEERGTKNQERGPVIRIDGSSIDIAIKAVPKSSRNRVAGTTGGRLKVCVTAAPEKGRANAAVIETIAEWLQLPKSAVAIIAGETSPQKTARVRIDLAVLEARLREVGA